MRLFTFFTLALDHLFFPGFKKVHVKKPFFIIGHPRSGTTFLHHLLTQTNEAAAFKCWHLLFPALTARKLFKPLIHRLIKTGKSEVMPEETGHKMDLDKVEEEEMLFLNTYDTQFVPAGLLGLDDCQYPELQHHDQQPKSHRFRSLRFLNGCFQRQIHYTGKSQIIAQTHFSTHRLKTMLEFYPDAKFVYIIRNPHHVVPSFLSLLHKSIDFRWGLAQIPKDILQRYNERRYQSMIDLYRYFYDLQKNNELPIDRVMVMPYDLLRNDLVRAFKQIVDFCGIEVSDELREKVTHRAENQQSYKRKHQVMDLADFGLSHERISKDFAFVFEEYGIEDQQS
ncbi:MAG: sulfotransferase [Desulfobulbaceae bacterium]|nr:sulfotransferase [Desulfobulbaceae bacterium]